MCIDRVREKERKEEKKNLYSICLYDRVCVQVLAFEKIPLHQWRNKFEMKQQPAYEFI